MTQKLFKKVAFTMAEVLIVIGVIGVVSALTFPALIHNAEENLKAKRIENIKQKLSKATDNMAAISDLRGYSSTITFLEEFKKHLGIVKICEGDKIAECWPKVEVTDKRKDIIDVSDNKTYTKLKLNNSITIHDWAEPVGIVTRDGTNMILVYDRNCSITADSGLVYDKASATSNTLGCLAGVYDWNGGGRPNRLGDDIQTLGVAAGMSGKCASQYSTSNDICIAGEVHGPVSSITKAECESAVKEGKLGIKACYYNNDNWAGAVKDCGGVSNMFTPSELEQIASEVYSNGTYDKDKAAALGLPSSTPFSIWSGTELSESSRVLNIRFYSTYASVGQLERCDRYRVLCKG